MPRSRSVHLPEKKNNLKFVLILLVIGILIITGSVYLGRSDKGQIDVSNTITNSNEKRKSEGDTGEATPTVPPEFANKVNGGLVPQGGNSNPPAPTPAPAPEPTTTTASTTQQESSSTPAAKTTPAKTTR